MHIFAEPVTYVINMSNLMPLPSTYCHILTIKQNTSTKIMIAFNAIHVVISILMAYCNIEKTGVTWGSNYNYSLVCCHVIPVSV